MSALLGAALAAQFAPANTGELQFRVSDATGAGLAATVALVNQAQQFNAVYKTNDVGELVARRLSFGTYQVTVIAEGFTPYVGMVSVRSVVAAEVRVTLSVAIQTSSPSALPGR